MKRDYSRMLLTTFLILGCTVLKAQNFEVGGICYNITDETNKTVEVAKKSGGYYLYEIKIPQTVTYSGKTYNVTAIGKQTFISCYTLTDIEIPNSVTTLGDYAFNGCNALKNIIIPNSVTEIGEAAFANCSELEYINLPENITIINSGIFNNCSKLTTIEIPNNVEKIGSDAFKACINLKEVIIPDKVTSIESKAFYKCSNITKVTSLIPAKKLFEIETNIFNGINYTSCTLYVPYGAKEKYSSTLGWKSFKNIVELEKTEEEEEPTEVTINISQYGSATYCSPYALNFSGINEMKAYTATGYNTGKEVLTLTRVQTSKENVGLFLIAEPGEYIVPVIDNSEDYSLNMLVGTLEEITVNNKSDDGNYINLKYTVVGNNTPMFYQFEDGSTLSANKAYLQLPVSLFPNSSKSVSVRFDDGTTTEIDEIKELKEENKTFYDMQGREVENPIKGIYIIDGKKIVK